MMRKNDQKCPSSAALDERTQSDDSVDAASKLHGATSARCNTDCHGKAPSTDVVECKTEECKYVRLVMSSLASLISSRKQHIPRTTTSSKGNVVYGTSSKLHTAENATAKTFSMSVRAFSSLRAFSPASSHKENTATFAPPMDTATLAPESPRSTQWHHQQQHQQHQHQQQQQHHQYPTETPPAPEPPDTQTHQKSDEETTLEQIEAQVEEIFLKYDVNGDGEISFAEYMRAMTGHDFYLHRSFKGRMGSLDDSDDRCLYDDENSSSFGL
jgi:hypothetical protein